MLVQDSVCFFASYKILTLLWRLSLEDSRLPCVKIFHTIAFNQKRPDFNMETTLGSALYCLQLQYVHLYSSLFVFWKKTPTERNRKKKVVLLQQTWKLSVTHHHMASWILILSTCIPEESYLFWASFSLPVSLLSLTLACCGNSRLAGVSNICSSHTNVYKLLRQPGIWPWSWHQSTCENFAHLLSFQNQKGWSFS